MGIDIDPLSMKTKFLKEPRPDVSGRSEKQWGCAFSAKESWDVICLALSNRRCHDD